MIVIQFLCICKVYENVNIGVKSQYDDLLIETAKNKTSWYDKIRAYISDASVIIFSVN